MVCGMLTGKMSIYFKQEQNFPVTSPFCDYFALQQKLLKSNCLVFSLYSTKASAMLVSVLNYENEFHYH